MIDFSQVKEMSIPEGVVAQIMSGGVLLWKKPSAGARFVGYTGTYTEAAVEIDGAAYTLYTLTTSGTLTVEGEGALFWMCGSGAGGKTAGLSSDNERTSGNGGGGGYVAQGQLTGGEYAVVIGAGGSSNANGNKTKIGDTYSADGGKVNGNGGSGGGGAVKVNSISATKSAAGTGAGVSTLPFGLESLHQHSPGGGAGGGLYEDEPDGTAGKGRGGYGGSNGSDGKQCSSTTSNAGGTGGNKGGGTGGKALYSGSSAKGTDGSFYGAGGGGGGSYFKLKEDPLYSLGTDGVGGNGYQGVVYIAVPA